MTLAAERLELDDLFGVDRARESRAVRYLQLFHLRERRAEPDDEVVRQVVAADGQDAGVEDAAVDEDGDVRRAAADVGEDDALLLLLLLEDGLGRRERRKDQLLDLHAGALDALREVLDGRHRAGDDVRVHVEPLAEHADRVADVVLAVDDEEARDVVQDLAVRREAERFRAFHRALDVLFGDRPLLAGDRDDAAVVERVAWLPPMLTCADMMRVPLERSALSTELAIASVASWMLSTMPFLTPCEGVMPTPRMRRSSSGVTSPTRVQILLLPTSIPASMLSLKSDHLLGHWKEGRSPNRRSRTWPTIASRPSLPSIACQTASL